jgi:hypothetical protein
LARGSRRSRSSQSAFFRAIEASGARALLIGRRVLVARSVPTIDGQTVAFEDLWGRRQCLQLGGGVSVNLPSVPDLILTKRFGGRPKDLEDIRQLEILRREHER